MLKHILIIVSLVQVMNCVVMRNNPLDWSNEKNYRPETGCAPGLSRKNPSLKEKICGYCLAKCAQGLEICLFEELSKGPNQPSEYCENITADCERACLTDKRTIGLAIINWPKVMINLRAYNIWRPTHDENQQ